MRDLAVVLLAAGEGARLGHKLPKAFVPLMGEPLIEHALRNLVATTGLAHVSLVAHNDFHDDAEALADRYSTQDINIVVVQGGEVTRQDSVRNGLAFVPDDLDVVLIHDAARAFATAELFERVAAAVRESGKGVVPVLPVVDTIKRAEAELILETVDRSDLRVAQTPQGFPIAAFKAAHALAGAEFTDDAALFQAAGGAVTSVIGQATAFKITHPADLAAAERLLSAELRTGIGTDVHRFATDGRKPLNLAGIEWPDEVALDGHSDGDAVCHAIVDALLAAAGLGDIGGVFGVDRPEYAGATGAVFIDGALAMLREQGWTVQNVSVQIIGNRPKLAPRRDLAQERLTALVGTPVSIGATTTDGLGFLGNSEGVAAVATALIAGRPKVG
jgi:2-C-methyl-D-erythritol 4-phosphate cytidylyltransferase / 2-C-methyl-D-erythritol 2,4-cyclodiphosphate synthase